VTERRVVSPLRDFFHQEAAGGIVLVAATVLALIWANSPWKESYFDLWHTHLSITIGTHSIDLDLQEWVNDALMAIFFLVVGLEIKREVVEGELRDPRTAALPAIAAVGGMVVPALIYVALNAGGAGVEGWGIPMATDIAMAIGVVSLLGSRVAPSLKLFLLALAIVDDIGAILVIAIFYSDDIDFGALGVAVALVGAVALLRWLGVRYVAPTRPFRQRELIDEQALLDLSTAETAAQTATLARESVSVVEWMEHLLHPWTSFLIVPLFALANAGIPITSTTLSHAFSSRVTYGVLFGLVVGKFIGVVGASWIATRLRIGTLPRGATWRGIFGVGAVAWIGFTVSIFVAGLAFDEKPLLENDAKIGILAASIIAATIGSLVLTRQGPSPTKDP
jgi:NhaA family Na+:H+ antiporter